MTGTCPLWFPPLIAAVFGAVIGSFLNVCIYRIPLGRSVVSPPSSCPACGARIAPYDNVPVLAWLWLRGRCRSCGAGISPRYPVIEALTALLFLGLALRYGPTWELLAALIFGCAMIVVTFIDLDHRLIPDAVTLPGVLLGFLSAAVSPVTLVESLLGAALGYALLFGLGRAYLKLTGVEGMGGGDVKLAAMLGAFLGWKGLLMTVFLASLIGTLAGLVLMARGRGGRRTALPFGTLLAPVAVGIQVWGADLLRWYLDLARRS